ncbi:MAG: 50S ribosomal protein L22 [bacterium JZ-2024 1]
MQASAHIAGVRLSAKKASRVAQLIRGKSVAEAENILRFLPHKSGRILHLLLQSAVANAENNFNLAREDLKVLRVDVGRGYYLRRMRAAARGRGMRIQKPTAFLRVVVWDGKEEKEEEG